MELDLSDAHQREVYEGVYEPEDTSIVCKYLTPGMTFVDAGANVGYYSALALSYGARVIAFEPLPKLYEKLRQLPGVDARNLALGDRQGRIAMYVPRSTGVCDPSVYKYAEDMEEVAVEVDTLDGQLSTETQIDLLKIDVEGHEMVVIAGGHEVLKKTDAVLCEFNQSLLDLAGSSVSELYEQFERLGFDDGIHVPPLGACDNRFLTRHL